MLTPLYQSKAHGRILCLFHAAWLPATYNLVHTCKSMLTPDQGCCSVLLLPAVRTVSTDCTTTMNGKLLVSGDSIIVTAQVRRIASAVRSISSPQDI